MLNRYKGVNCAVMLVMLPLVFSPISSVHANEYSDYKVKSSNTDVEINDPYEDVNRAVFKFNNVLDKYLLIPVVKGYRFILPEKARHGVSNALDNIVEPVTFLNSIFQGDFEYAGTSFWRFTVNTTLGAAGIMDVASAAGMEKRQEDFGQTLGAYGVDSGSYLVLPFIGPSSTRDAGGLVVDAFSNPFLYMVDEYTYAGYRAVAVVDGRDGTLDITNEIERTSLDPYAALRSLYLQNREHKVRNGESRAKN